MNRRGPGVFPALIFFLSLVAFSPKHSS